jgi:hypothetical protein
MARMKLFSGSRGLNGGDIKLTPSFGKVMPYTRDSRGTYPGWDATRSSQRRTAG